MNQADDEATRAPVPDFESAAPPRGRTTPSGAVVWAWEQLKQHHSRLKKSVDIGCGKGRNSLFLARKGLHVTAMDFTPNAISALHKSATYHNLNEKIRAVVHDVTEEWPIESHETDLAIDAFCFKHLASQESYETYKENLLRVLCVHGYYLISFGSIGDGYYGRYRRYPNQASVPVDDAVTLDPENSIESTLFTREKVIEFLSPQLEVYAEVRNRDLPAKIKDDGTYALLFCRAPKWFNS